MQEEYSTDERLVIKAIAKAIRKDDYRRVDDEYMFEMKWAEILPEGTALYDRLVQALERLRQRNFDSYSAEETTLNGYIMKAKINRTTEIVKLLISPDLVLQLLGNYRDDTTRRSGAQATIEELKELVRVG